MCCTFSALIHKTRGLLWAPDATDSHELLLTVFMPGEQDERPPGLQPFVRYELTPRGHSDAAWLDPATYVGRLDESSRPAWFTAKRETDACQQMRNQISAMVVTDQRTILSGPIILGPGADVILVRPRILFAVNGATIQYAGGATILDAGEATIQDAGGATILDAGEATIQDAGRATIQNAGEATIQNAGRATIQNAGRATIQNAGEATIQNAGEATIQDAGRAKITL